MMRRRLTSTEEDIHTAVIDLLRWKADPRTIWFHPPNGLPVLGIEPRASRRKPLLLQSPAVRRRTIIANAIIAKFKRLGMRPGVADICLTLPGGRSAYLEIKSEKGRQSPEQKAFELHCEMNGAPYAVARSAVEAHRILTSWGALEERVRRAA